MLRHIHIRDFAIVDEVCVEFAAGMSTLTGETGAGKSILLDALALCLGDRADTTALPAHARQAEVSVSFDAAPGSSTAKWLEEQALVAEDECIVRRVISKQGRSQAWINGRPATLQMLTELGEQLVGIHGQHAHQALLKSDVQRHTLDEYGRYSEALTHVHELAAEYRGLREEIARLAGGSGEHGERTELLRYQVDELAALDLDREGIEALDAEQRRLSSAGTTIQVCQSALAALYDDEASAQTVLAGVARQLGEHADVDPDLAAAENLLQEALVQIQEGCGNLRHFVDTMEVDPARLEWVESRLSELNDLARKHRCRPEELPERLEALQSELAELDDAESRLTTLRERAQALLPRYQEAAHSLYEQRRDAAEQLSGEVSALIRELGMPGGELRIEVTHEPERTPNPLGLDDVRFQVRTNPDQRFASLARVASGGELSRIGLALEVSTAHVTRVPTLIFDEADAGIGGAVAEVVGRKLCELGARHQVLCVTHLPQVAAQGHHQLKIEKAYAEGRTRTNVLPLDADERHQEIARMLGGVEITASTLAHAREMLNSAAG